MLVNLWVCLLLAISSRRLCSPLLHGIWFWSLPTSFICCQESAWALKLLGLCEKVLMPAYSGLCEKNCNPSSDGDKLTLRKVVISWLCTQEKSRRCCKNSWVNIWCGLPVAKERLYFLLNNDKFCTNTCYQRKVRGSEGRCFHTILTVTGFFPPLMGLETIISSLTWRWN